MKIEYKFVNGETVDIEVSGNFVNGEKVDIEVYGNFEEFMLELKYELENHNRKETRRHGSMEEFNDKSEVWRDKNSEPTEDQILKGFDKDKLHIAISKLTLEEQDFINKIFLQKNTLTYSEYAKRTNVKESSLHHKLWRIKKKLREILYK